MAYGGTYVPTNFTFNTAHSSAFGLVCCFEGTHQHHSLELIIYPSTHMI